MHFVIVGCEKASSKKSVDCSIVHYWKNTSFHMASRLFVLYTLWQYGLWSFQTGDTKLKRFLPENQHTERKLLNLEFWINGELSKIT